MGAGVSGSEFVEVGDRCWFARHEWFDVNVGVVAGAGGFVVVDTHASGTAARAVAARVRTLVGRLAPATTAPELVAIVNTHEHFDHTFGNGTVREALGPAPVVAHERAASRTVPAGERIKRLYAEDHDDPHREEVLATEIVPADRVFSSVLVLDLGDRRVELIHPGRGHTGGDLVVHVPDAGVLFAGDLVEESAEHGSMPGYGEDCYPMEWPATLDLVLGLVTPQTVVVPGHGAAVDRDFVEDQRSRVGQVAQTIQDLAHRGVPLAQAPGAGQWPWPADRLADAVRRGYAQLPREGRGLPLA